jgi:hypothetical protein
LVSNGQVQTPAVYPTYQIPDIYDGPYADQTCVHPALCGLLLLTDVVTGIQYQSNIPAYIGDNYVYANVNYEVHSGQNGLYTVVTSLDITNKTDTTLSLDYVSINNYGTRFIPKSSILIKPDHLLNVVTQIIIPGSSDTINLTFSSQVYKPISISATYP